MNKDLADALAKHLTTLAHETAWLRMLEAGVQSVVANQPTLEETKAKILRVQETVSRIFVVGDEK